MKSQRNSSHFSPPQVSLQLLPITCDCLWGLCLNIPPLYGNTSTRPGLNLKHFGVSLSWYGSHAKLSEHTESQLKDFRPEKLKIKEVLLKKACPHSIRRDSNNRNSDRAVARSDLCYVTRGPGNICSPSSLDMCGMNTRFSGELYSLHLSAPFFLPSFPFPASFHIVLHVCNLYNLFVYFYVCLFPPISTLNVPCTSCCHSLFCLSLCE